MSNPFRDEPLDRRLERLDAAISDLQKDPPREYRLLFDLNEWRWPLVVLGSFAMAWHFLPAGRTCSHHETTVEVEPSTVHIFRRSTLAAPTMRYIPPLSSDHDRHYALATGCTWDTPDVADCGYASGLWCENHDDCLDGELCDAFGECLPKEEFSVDLDNLDKYEVETADGTTLLNLNMVCDSNLPGRSWNCHIEPGEPVRYEDDVPPNPWVFEPEFFAGAPSPEPIQMENW